MNILYEYVLYINILINMNGGQEKKNIQKRKWLREQNK